MLLGFYLRDTLQHCYTNTCDCVFAFVNTAQAPHYYITTIELLDSSSLVQTRIFHHHTDYEVLYYPNCHHQPDSTSPIYPIQQLSTMSTTSSTESNYSSSNKSEQSSTMTSQSSNTNYSSKFKNNNLQNPFNLKLASPFERYVNISASTGGQNPE